MGSILSTLLTVLFGAVIGFVPNYLLERRKERALLRTRWDQSLFTISADLISAARNLDVLAARLPDPAAIDQLVAEHQQLRALSEQIRLLGSPDVQVAARWVVRHAYAVRKSAEGAGDPREAEFPERSPRDRLRDALDALSLAVRVQLRVADARVVAPREPLPDTAPAAPRTP